MKQKLPNKFYSKYRNILCIKHKTIDSAILYWLVEEENTRVRCIHTFIHCYNIRKFYKVNSCISQFVL